MQFIVGFPKVIFATVKHKDALVFTWSNNCHSDIDCASNPSISLLLHHYTSTTQSICFGYYVNIFACMTISSVPLRTGWIREYNVPFSFAYLKALPQKWNKHEVENKQKDWQTFCLVLSESEGQSGRAEEGGKLKQQVFIHQKI